MMRGIHQASPEIRLRGTLMLGMRLLGMRLLGTLMLTVVVFTVPAPEELHGQAVARTEVAPSEVVFLPQSYFVGDVVEVRAIIRTDEILDLSISGALPSTEWVEFRNVNVLRRADGYEVRILFQPFFVGTRQLPAIDLGALRLGGISAVVNALGVDEELELASIRDQLLLPGTRFLITAVVAMLVAIPLVVILARGWLVGWWKSLVRRYRENRPYRTLVKQLRTLGAEMHELDAKRYYTRLLDLMRAYLDGRYDAHIRSATTGELPRYLSRAGIDDETGDRIVSLFQFGDLVRFANQRVTVQDRSDHLELVRDVSAQLQRRGKERARVGA